VNLSVTGVAGADGFTDTKFIFDGTPISRTLYGASGELLSAVQDTSCGFVKALAKKCDESSAA
jgi:hypothetical protein